jgi:di/tricarboxylate transporter
MTFEIGLILIIIALAFVLFATEALPIDVVALLTLGILIVTGRLTLEQSLAGFSNPAVITIATLFILSHTLKKSGILEYVIIRINKIVSSSKILGLSVYWLSIAVASAFVNNTAVVALFIPVTLRMAERFDISPSKILIPLSYSAILGGTLTLVGTSTNLLVNSIFVQSGNYTALGLFEFARFGIVNLLIGITYVVTVGPRLIPSRIVKKNLTENYQLGEFLTEVKILEDSPMVGNTCLDRGINKNYDIIVLSILRGDRVITNQIRDTKLKAGDILSIRGSLDDFIRMKKIEKVSLISDEKMTQKELESEDNVLIEGVVRNRSRIVGHSLMKINFRRQFGAFVLAIRREGKLLRSKIATVVLKPFDTLLIYGTREKVNELASSGNLIILGEVDAELKKHRFWWMSIVVIFIVIIVAALAFMTIVKAALLGVIVLLAFRVVTPQEAYRSIHWQVIILIAALIPLQYAVAESGTAEWIGSTLLALSSIFPAEIVPFVLLAMVYLITTVLTEVASNAATAIIMTPIVLSLSLNLGLDPRPFIFGICFAASASFITPVGYQTNLMIYGPGGYKFTDYIKVGSPLAITLWIAATFLIPVIWPFTKI